MDEANNAAKWNYPAITSVEDVVMLGKRIRFDHFQVYEGGCGWMPRT